VATSNYRQEGCTVTEGRPAPGFEIKTATIEEFLRLLHEREEEETSPGELRGATRRAVFVAQMLDQRSSSYGYPSVRRYIVAVFAHGCDLVTHSRTTSSAVELPEIAIRAAERQHEAYEEIKAEIERGLEGMGLDLPVYEGSLRRLAEQGEN
jgi:hypothetical protein